MAATLRTLTTVYLLLIMTTQTTSKLSIHKNIIINQIKDISVSHSTWRISLIVDLIPYKKLMMSSLRDLRLVSKLTLKTIDNNSGSFTSAHIDHFKDIADSIAHLNKTRTNLENTLRNYTLLRKRRAIFGFVGEALEFLFGTSTEKDLSDIRQALNLLHSNQEKIAHVTKQSLSLYNMTRENVKRNRERINEINGGIRDLYKTLRTQSNKINNSKHFLNIYIKLNQVLGDTKFMLSEIATHLTDLTNIINHLSLGRVAPNVVSPTKLMFILEEIKSKLPPSLSLPFETRKNIWAYYKTLRCTTKMNNNKIYIMLELPLINKNKMFTIYRLYNLPLPYTNMKKDADANLIARYKLATNAVAINREKTLYTELTKKQLSDCTKPETTFCQLHNPILPYNTHRSCALSLINPNREKIKRYCKIVVDYKPRLPIATYVEDGLWIISSRHAVTFNVNCEKKSFSKTVRTDPPVDILKIESSCTAYSDYLSLPPFYRLSSKYVLDNDAIKLRDILKNQSLDLWEDFENNTNIKIWNKQDLSVIKEKPIGQLLKDLEMKTIKVNQNEYTWWQIMISIFIITILIAIIIRYFYRRFRNVNDQHQKEATVMYTKGQISYKTSNDKISVKSNFKEEELLPSPSNFELNNVKEPTPEPPNIKSTDTGAFFYFK